MAEAIFGKTFGNVKTVFDLSNIFKENVKKNTTEFLLPLNKNFVVFVKRSRPVLILIVSHYLLRSLTPPFFSSLTSPDFSHLFWRCEKSGNVEKSGDVKGVSQ